MMGNAFGKSALHAKPLWYRALLAALVLLALLSVVRAGWSAVIGEGEVPDSASEDFLWHEARALLHRDNPYDVDLSGNAIYTSSPEWGQWLTPAVPSSLVFLWPYAIFSYQTATVLWLISNLVATYLILLLGFRLFLPGANAHAFLVVGLLLVFSAPWRFSVGLGQHGLVCLAAFLLSFHLAERGRGLLAALALAVSFLKYSLIFPFLPFFLRHRHYRAVALAFVLHGLLILFVAFWLRELPHVPVFDHLAVALAMQGEGLVDVFAIDRQFDEVLGAPGAGVIALVLLLVIGWLCVVSTADDLVVLSTITLLSMILLYHRIHDFLVLVFPLLLLAREGLARNDVGTPALLSKDPIGRFYLAALLLCTVVFWLVLGLVLSVERRWDALQIAGLRLDFEWLRAVTELLAAVAWYGALVAGVAVLARHLPPGVRRAGDQVHQQP